MKPNFYTYLVKVEVENNGKTHEAVRRIRLPELCQSIKEMRKNYDWICNFKGKVRIKEYHFLKEKKNIFFDDDFDSIVFI